ncbi:single-stranded DNA-binding protein [Lactobacillus taiwanensis]|uniref:single-stranded DNA-binding protein n=1 Tax=Lactobacillus taiwanensis TaxID=508451 RepID=UPI000B9901B1|nr:single-stranded DNA-binding protein [Lactobacillus taiwanensis]OYR97493.1 single-stranded DNA-binding protein [Lactobacillus taiwanensis]OYS02004.1 single-stranded DNA-binding protein [Lactobacillus taiwanensis]OYS14873.1 single-stranded DNA-binding protein [Lactobacillus taiwanensis]OYS31798.1 single-stranded DNA-binding protein [Lactobacillus taiwanensis]OYS33645.1 single-stranded DNA-binding protein [Lactobacillus taiwanensis]
MGLLEALNKVKSEKYDPKKDDISSGFQPIPDGTYTVTLSGVNHGVWEKSGTDFVRFSFDVVTGEQAGRQEHITPILASKKSNGDPMPESVLARSIKMVQKIGAMVGFDVPDKVFMGANESEDYEMIQNEFREAGVIGKLLKLTIKSSPNKKDPDNPWRNYKFEEAEQPTTASVEDPFKDAATGMEITDDDLPFGK